MVEAGSGERFDVAEDGGEEFGNGGVDVYGALDVGVGGAGVHGVDDAVDGFVAAGSEDGGAEDLFCVGVDEDFDEAFGFALFDGACDSGHGAGADESGFAGFAYFAFG